MTTCRLADAEAQLRAVEASTSAGAAESSSSGGGGSSGLSGGAVAGIAVACVAATLAACGVGFVLYRRRMVRRLEEAQAIAAYHGGSGMPIP